MFDFLKKNEKIAVKKKALTDTLGIDLGTLNTVVAKPSGDKFDLYKIPSVVAVKKEDSSYVLAVGEEAKSMLGRTPEDIVAVRPLRKGVIESIAQAEALLVYAMDKGSGENTESIDRIVIGIPGDASEVEKRAVEEIGRKAGASYVLVISEGLSAAIGTGLPIAEAAGTMVLDIGAGSSALGSAATIAAPFATTVIGSSDISTGIPTSSYILSFNPLSWDVPPTTTVLLYTPDISSGDILSRTKESASISFLTIGSAASATNLESISTFFGLLVSMDFPIALVVIFSTSVDECTIPTFILAFSASCIPISTL